MTLDSHVFEEAYLCILVLSLSILLFLYTPGVGVQYSVLAGALAMIAIGEVLIRWAEIHRRRD